MGNVWCIGGLGKPSVKMRSSWKSLFRAPFRRYNACVNDYPTMHLNRHEPRARFGSRKTRRFPGTTMPEVVTMNSPCEQLGTQSGAERSDFKGRHSAPRAGCTSANSSQRDKRSEERRVGK